MTTCVLDGTARTEHAAVMDAATLDRRSRAYRQLASFCREGAPVDVKYVATMYRSADVAVFGGSRRTYPDPAAPVIVVTGRGTFVVPRRPKGFPRTTGRHLTGVWSDPESGPSAYAIGNDAPDLSTLGPMTDL